LRRTAKRDVLTDADDSVRRNGGWKERRPHCPGATLFTRTPGFAARFAKLFVRLRSARLDAGLATSFSLGSYAWMEVVLTTTARASGQVMLME
jgi:hypothetical protein